MKLVKLFASVLIIGGIAGAASSAANRERNDSFPSTPPAGFGREYVDADLIELQKREVARAEGKVPRSLSPGPRAAAISGILQRQNRELLDSLLDPNPGEGGAPSPNSGLARSLTKEQVSEVLAGIRHHPVVGDQESLRYDTPSRQIGYCFGRAAYVHWELLRRGLDPRSIGKIFAVGRLLHHGEGWSFHVATAARARGGGWWVIDGLNAEVLPIDSWMKMVLGWSEDSRRSLLRFYFSDPAKFRPLPGAYEEATLFSPVYRGYFRDLSAWFAEHPARDEEHFSDHSGTSAPK